MQDNNDLDLVNDPSILEQFSADTTGEADDDLSNQTTGSRPHIDPEPDVQVRLERVLKATNPLLEAARPLLRMLSDMPKSLPGGYEVLVELREALDREVRTFQTLCDKASLRREHVLSARYCLCTAIDEAALSTTWGEGRWASSSLAQRFHQDVRGGEKFFLLIGRLQTSPAEHVHLLELMYRILGLGFEGIYGKSPESRRQLESVRHNLLGILSNLRDPVSPALSPHWQGEAAGKLKLMKNFPVWVSASLLGLLLLGIFAWAKYGLLTQRDQVVTEIAQIAALRPPTIEVAKPINKPLLRLTELLKAEIAAGQVSVKETEKFSQVTLRGDSLFAMGKAETTDTLRPLIVRLGEEIAKVSGEVLIIGHSDSQAIKSPEFPNNQVLSEKRAGSVAALLIEKGVDKSRVKVVGKGDSLPIASNSTSEGRAVNRRVEILVSELPVIDAATSSETRNTNPSAPARQP